MIKASEKEKNTMITNIEDHDEKQITICSSKVNSEYLSPRQLVQSALAGCLSMTIRRELMNCGVEYNDVVVKADMDENLKFLFSVEIESNEDIDKIQACKQRAIEDCFIKGLLSNKNIIEEVEHMGISTDFDRCCG